MADDHNNSHGDDHGDGSSHGGGGGHGGSHGPGGHGGGEHEESGAPEWLISFADNVALMMGFFVILLAMAMSKPTGGGQGADAKSPAAQQDEVMLDFVIAMRQAFNAPIDINGSNPNESRLRKRMREQRSRSETNDPGPEGDNHRVQAIETSDYVQPTGIIPFDHASADIDRAGIQTAADVAEQLRGHRIFVEVRGHVSAAEAFKNPEAGMKLSHDRAISVARVLVEHGLKWNQIRIVGCADGSPASQRADEPSEHRTNQRVEIVVTKEALPADQFAAGSEDTSSGN